MRGAEMSWICFGTNSGKSCFSWVPKSSYFYKTNFALRFNGEDFYIEAKSIHNHIKVGQLGSYKNKPFITGHRDEISENKRTEIYDEQMNRWMPADDFPYTST